MNEPDLDILTRFTGHFDPDVESQTAEPPREIAALLKRFATGQSTAAERTRVTKLLQEHPEWLRHVARARQRPA